MRPTYLNELYDYIYRLVKYHNIENVDELVDPYHKKTIIYLFSKEANQSFIEDMAIEMNKDIVHGVVDLICLDVYISSANDIRQITRKIVNHFLSNIKTEINSIFSEAIRNFNNVDNSD